MSASSRLTRLLTLGAASCALTLALAGTALARPVSGPPDNAPAQSAAPPYKVTGGDHSVPDAAQVQGVLDDLRRGDAVRVAPATAESDSTDTVALILSIVAILTAFGAVTVTVARPRRRAVGA